jgi:hypothetical protein
MFEQRHFYAFIMRLTVEERVFILESYLKNYVLRPLNTKFLKYLEGKPQ